LDLSHVTLLNSLLASHAPSQPLIKVRVCLDLSRVLNPYIHDWPFCYMSVEDLILATPPTGHIALVDFKSYFKQLPHDPRQHHLMGFRFNGRSYLYAVCPFGVKTGPAYASTLTAVVCSFLLDRFAIRSVAYIDDIAIIGPTYAACKQHLAQSLDLFTHLGLQVSTEKVFPPSQCPTFLGISIDTVRQRLAIESERLLEYRDHITYYLLPSAPSSAPPSGGPLLIPPVELASILGELQRVSSVYFEGKTHLGALYALQRYRKGRVCTSGSAIPLSAAAAGELLWWTRHLDTMITSPRSVPWDQYWTTSLPSLTPFWSDASGAGGFGLVSERHALQGSVTLSDAERSSGSFELVPLLCALRLWGPSLRNRVLLWITDNVNNTRILNRGSSSLVASTHLLASELLALTHELSLTLLAVWTPRASIQLLDDLSKDVIRLDTPALQGTPSTHLL
jgi:hypothetical protein